jgi:putative nucleotidyltransferase with HDIG domain
MATPHQTHQQSTDGCFATRVLLSVCSRFSPLGVAIQKTNFRRLLATMQTLAELGPEVTAERDFSHTAAAILGLILQAIGAREGAMFTFSDRPAMLASVAASGFSLFPDTAIFPLLPQHVHALSIAQGPQPISSATSENLIGSHGNVAPELFRCIVPLKTGSKLAGMIALGRREGEGQYGPEEFEALGMLAHYVALALENHRLSQSLQQRISDNLRLVASLHDFYDHTLHAFASAIDSKDPHLQGHSLRVGRYAAGLGEALGMGDQEAAGLRAGGYLHDIGKITLDKYIFSKAGALEAREFREVMDHTTVGHQIVHKVEFPWPQIPEIVRWHHERADGSGYPDRLRSDEVSLPVRILAVADTFDAMTSERAYRPPLSVGEALSKLVRMSPQKYDPEVVQALLIQIRRDAVGRNGTAFLDSNLVCNIAVSDVDHLAATVHHKATRQRRLLT